MNEFVKVVVEKAVTEPSFSVLYADMCVVLAARSQGTLSNDSKSKEADCSFYRALLTMCQTEATRHTSLRQVLNQAEPSDDHEATAATKKAAKTRISGTMRFVGELLQRRLIAAHLPLRLINSLLDGNPTEYEVECTCELYESVGFFFENFRGPRDVMTEHMQKMREMQQSGLYSNRIKFKIEDVLDLRSNNWRRRVFKDKAKALAEIRRDFRQDELRGGQVHTAQEARLEKIGERQPQVYDAYYHQWKQIYEKW
eukprot:Polyplicarium_translucidae@DN2804_c0_g1_i1.p1